MNLSRFGLVVSAVVFAAGCSDKASRPVPQAVPTEKATTVVSAAPPAGDVPHVASAAPIPSATPALSAKPATVAAKESDSASLRVKRLVIAKNVEKREPVDSGVVFKKSELGKIYAFVEVENPEKGKSEVVVKFLPPGKKTSKSLVSLDVGEAARWRTWASTRNIDELGTWQAVVTTKDGRELARQSFDVVSSGSDPVSL